MRKWYFIFRIAAYICSLGGLAVALYAGQQVTDPDLKRTLSTVGGTLIAAGFASFLVVYGIYVYSRIFKD